MKTDRHQARILAMQCLCQLEVQGDAALEQVDEFLAAGMIPFSLIRWEITGSDDEIKELW